MYCNHYSLTASNANKSTTRHALSIPRRLRLWNQTGQGIDEGVEPQILCLEAARLLWVYGCFALGILSVFGTVGCHV